MKRPVILTTWCLGICGLAVLATLYVFSVAPVVPTADDLLPLGLLIVLTAGGVAFPIEVAPKIKIGVGSTAIFAALLLFGVAAAVVVTVLGMVLAYTIRPGHNSTLARLFNIATLVLGVIAAGGGMTLISGSPLLTSAIGVREIVALVVGAGLFVLTNSLLVAVAADLKLGQPLLRHYLLDQREKAPHTGSLLLLGALAALVGAGQPWAILLVAIPMAMVALSLRQTAQIRRQTCQALEQLADVVDLRDPYTADHSRRVAKYTEALCHELGLSRAETDIIVRAARVHDIGKLGMSSAIVSEARPLSLAELTEMRRHPVIGANIVARFSDFRAGAAIVLHHHERWDGTGYPDGLSGEKIPLGARVIAVCDTFDAMTSDRPYRSALPASAAFAEIARCAGSQFDPSIAEAFLRLHGYPVAPLPVRQPRSVQVG
ncbi:MAG: hypothetical protein KatS3mg061_0934 [Dehalococcoidia bacterium]|nr:MAG: hypothetical protein KatS3mg061_0934 [Dehalococcoidia bacterium]